MSNFHRNGARTTSLNLTAEDAINMVQALAPRLGNRTGCKQCADGGHFKVSPKRRFSASSARSEPRQREVPFFAFDPLAGRLAHAANSAPSLNEAMRMRLKTEADRKGAREQHRPSSGAQDNDIPQINERLFCFCGVGETRRSKSLELGIWHFRPV